MKRALAMMAAVCAVVLPLCRGGASGKPDIPLAESLDQKIATLSRLMIRERISRYSQAGSKIKKLDSFEMLVSVADGTEQYSEVKNGKSTFSHISQIGGVWSFGETVTMLKTTRELLGDRAPSGGDMKYHCAAGDRRWFVMVGPDTYWLDFDGSIRIDKDTGEIERIEWTSLPPPSAACVRQITWSVEFQPVTIAGRRVTAPKTGVYRVMRTNNTSEWNVTEFLELGLFGSESIIRFEP